MNVVSPLSTVDITRYFSHVGIIDKVVIPDVDGKIALIVSVHQEHVPNMYQTGSTSWSSESVNWLEWLEYANYCAYERLKEYKNAPLS